MNSGESSEAGLPGNPWHSLFQLQRLSRNVRKTSQILRLHVCYYMPMTMILLTEEIVS